MDTRTEILNLGEGLIRTKGYFSFSYADIAAQLKIKNAAIHYYFPSKADLGVAIIDRAINTVHSSSEKWAALPEDVQLKKFLQTYFENNTKGLACLMGGLSASYGVLPVEMQVKLREMGEVILDWLTKCLTDGRRKGLFRFQEKPEAKAMLIVSNMMASLLLGRVLDGKVFTTIYKQVSSNV